MNNIIVNGKTSPLHGEVEISGAKNSILKLMVATTLAAGKYTFSNVPRIGDVETMAELLRSMGSTIEWGTGSDEQDSDSLTIHTPENLNPVAPYELVEKMRASVLVLAPLLVRFNEAEVALPGGDNLGPRPIDMLLDVLENLGAETQVEHGYIKAKSQNLIGADLALSIPSVGATETAMMAALGAKGITTIENAAREPEVVDLANFLNKMAGLGGKKVDRAEANKENENALSKVIEGAGTSTITINPEIVTSQEKGNSQFRINGALQPADHTVIPDRIEAATFLSALGVTGGEIFLKGANVDDMTVLLAKFRETGMTIEPEVEVGSTQNIGIWASHPKGKKLKPVDVQSLPYPGLPTDAIPPLVAMLSMADGVSVVTENLFDSRFGYTDELIRMGAYIRTEGHHAIIRGVEKLSGSPVKALDIRAGAALICAGLGAVGQTQISDTHHINRGYDNLVGKLQSLGAEIDVVEVDVLENNTFETGSAENKKIEI